MVNQELMYALFLFLSAQFGRCLSQGRNFDIPPDYVSTDYCEPMTSIPEEPVVNCGSCLSRCGTKQNLRLAGYCACDDQCLAYGDCCPDFASTCPEEYDRSQDIRGSGKYLGTSCVYLSMDSLKNGTGLSFPKPANVKMISVCRSTGKKCPEGQPQNILQPNIAIPITDMETGLIYVNFECAKSNGVKSFNWWKPHLDCDIWRVQKDETVPEITNSTMLKNYIDKCHVKYSTVPKALYRSCQAGYVIETCQANCSNDKAIEQCGQSPQTDYFSIKDEYNRVFKNVLCALCNGQDLKGLVCGEVSTAISPAGGASVFSLSLLFDFNPEKGLIVGRHPCPEFYARPQPTDKCRRVKCPKEFRLVEENCLPIIETVTFASVSILFKNPGDGKTFFNKFPRPSFVSPLEEQLKTNSEEFLKDEVVNIAINVSKHLIESNYKNVNFSLDAQFEFEFDSKMSVEPYLSDITQNISSLVKDLTVKSMYMQGIKPGSFDIDVDGAISYKGDTFSNCTWYLYKSDEFNLTGGNLILTENMEIYSKTSYVLTEGDALVCVYSEDFPMVHLDVSLVLGILTIIFISISIICLAVRSILQFCLVYYSGFISKLQFNIVLALLLAFSTLLIGGLVSMTNNRVACASFGVLMYYFFLVSFAWMFCLSLDTWLTFRPSSQFFAVRDKRRSLLKYVLPTWLIPLIFVIIVVVLDEVDINLKFKPHFGYNICWFNHRYALLIYFGLPVLLLLCLTLIFFILTIVHLRKTQSRTVRPSNAKESHPIWIYLRQFALMGITWLFGFVAAFVGHTALWIIFIILNASQGILIFISFVLRKPVLTEIGGKVSSVGPSETSKTSSSQVMKDISSEQSQKNDKR